MAQIPFNVSARTARLIGRENVANAEGALIELVKNCYDADSTISIILIDKQKDTILIVDSGIGMNDSVINNQWMTIGTDDKLNNAITETGRIKSGAKGIGRFSLDRLGERCTMITSPKKSNSGYRWTVNWTAFEEIKDGRNINLSEVYAGLDEINRINYKNELLAITDNPTVHKLIARKDFENGTVLKITGLRDEWKKDSVQRVFSNLELLTPPDGSNKMLLYFYSGEEPDKYGKLGRNRFKDFDYKVVASYKKNDKTLINLEVFRNEFDLTLIDNDVFNKEDMKSFPFDLETFKKEQFTLKKTFPDLMKGFKDKFNLSQTIGDFEFTFYFLKKSFSKNDREIYGYKDFLGNRKLWLDEFGGVKLYRDNFRVRPFGEPRTQGYDWLMLGDRYRESPAAVKRKGAWRVAANQTAGVVKFSRITMPAIEDKSSREGIQENDTFDLFKNLLIGVVKVLEDDRSTIAYNLSALHEEKNEEEKASEDSTKIANEEEELASSDSKSSDSEEETKKKTETLKKGIKAKDKKIEEQGEELSISRAMASAGLMIASFSHEFHNIKNKLSTRTKNLRVLLTKVIDDEKLKTVQERQNPFKLIDNIDKQDQRILQWINFSIGLTKKDRRKNKHVKVVNYLESFIDSWEYMLEERKITFDFDHLQVDRDKTKLKISELDLDTVFDNLLTNSIEAYQKPGFKGDKVITIKLQQKDKNLIVNYSDNGPGIPKEYKSINIIFNPFETSKKDDKGNDIGTGLGMWLLKSTMDSNKAKVELLRPKVGFEARLSFNLIK
jgi:signal transduction histidine kinase